jgi:hypothetical protein
MLVAGAILSDGPIRWIHITHVALATALLIAGILTHTPRILTAVVLTAVCISSVLGLSAYFSQPDRYWSSTVTTISVFRSGDEPVYAQQTTILWALQVNSPTTGYIALLPAEAERPPAYLYIDMVGWQPSPPPECATTPLWSDATGLRLLSCAR